MGETLEHKMAVSDTAFRASRGLQAGSTASLGKGDRYPQHWDLRASLDTPMELLLESEETFLFQPYLENTLQKQ